MQMFILSIHLESIMGGKKKSNRQTPKGKMFSDEWVKHNSWMGDENELAVWTDEYKRLVAQCKTKVRMPTFEQFLDNPPTMINFVKNQPIFEEDHPPMFLNNQQPIPVPKIRKEVNLYKEWKKENERNLAIFNEMLGEKAIKAGSSGVGEPHRGWGNSRRR